MKQKNSSIEILRILCMIAIMIHHYVVHGGYSATQYITNTEMILIAISSFGKIASCIFIVISGYFLINSEWKVKKTIYICFKTFLIFAIITIIFSIIGKRVYTLQEICLMFIDQWFIRNYIVLCFVYPMINKFLKVLNRKWYTILLILSLIFWSVIPTIVGVSGDKLDIGTFLIMYSIGGYIRLYSESNGTRRKIYGILSLTSIIVIVLTICVMIAIGRKYNLTYLISRAKSIGLVNNILSVFCTISVFQYFINATFTNAKINYISESMLSVYLIHDNILIRKLIWKIILPNKEFLYSNWLFLHMFLKISTVFIVCVIIDKLINRFLNPIVDKNFGNILKRE